MSVNVVLQASVAFIILGILQQLDISDSK